MIEPEGQVPLDVLEEREPRPQDGQRLDHIGPQVPVVVRPLAMTGVTEWLARISSRHDVHRFHGGPVHGRHVVQVGHVRPVVSEHRRGRFVELHEPRGLSMKNGLDR